MQKIYNTFGSNKKFLITGGAQKIKASWFIAFKTMKAPSAENLACKQNSMMHQRKNPKRLDSIGCLSNFIDGLSRLKSSGKDDFRKDLCKKY